MNLFEDCIDGSNVGLQQRTDDGIAVVREETSVLVRYFRRGEQVDEKLFTNTFTVLLPIHGLEGLIPAKHLETVVDLVNEHVFHGLPVDMATIPVKILARNQGHFLSFLKKTF